MLEPPPRLGAPSGFQRLLAAGAATPIDSYGQAKYVQMLVNAALARRAGGALCAVVCPGFVATDLTPAFFNVCGPLIRLVRCLVPFMMVTGERGCAPHLALMAEANPRSVASDAKWAMRGDCLERTTDGSPPLPLAEQERMWARAEQWMRVWRAAAAAADEGAGGGGGGGEGGGAGAGMGEGAGEEPAKAGGRRRRASLR